MINALSKKGRLIIVHAAGKDPANQIIKNIWPNEKPFSSLATEITNILNHLYQREFKKSNS